MRAQKNTRSQSQPSEKMRMEEFLSSFTVNVDIIVAFNLNGFGIGG